MFTVFMASLSISDSDHSFISDCDHSFISTFWKHVFFYQGVDLKISSGYHPQTDDQTEVINLYMVTYLRYMASD